MDYGHCKKIPAVTDNNVMTLITEERAPSAQEYCALRIKAGLSEKSLKAAEIGLHRGLSYIRHT